MSWRRCGRRVGWWLVADNPPAFPNLDVRAHDGFGISEGSPGMTLRDWFAGQVFAACFTNASGMGDMSREERNAQFAAGAALVYDAADAMLAARAQAPDSEAQS